MGNTDITQIIEPDNSSIKLDNLVCIIVTYYPDIYVLKEEIEAIPSEAAIVIVDNASGDEALIKIRQLATTRERIHILSNSSNVGLAAAINTGVFEAQKIWPGAKYILLLDQDSIPEPSAIERLLNTYKKISIQENSHGCVGPNLLDQDTGAQHGFHYTDGWRWLRLYADSNTNEIIKCSNLNGSGTLLPINFFIEMKGLDETLFIDHVDTDWSFRVLAAGGFLYGVADAVFKHRMGEAGKRLWFMNNRVWPQRTATRHYYLYRNAVFLMGRDYVPAVWKAWATLKLTITIPITLIIGPKRLVQLKSIIRGLKDGIFHHYSRF